MKKIIKEYWIELLLFFLVFGVFVSPYLLIRSSCFGFMPISAKANEIGDAVGGLTAPLIGLFSAVLVYRAFLEQKKANKIQIDSIKDQKIETEEKREYEYILMKIDSIEKYIFEFEAMIKNDTHTAEKIVLKGIIAIYEVVEMTSPNSIPNFPSFNRKNLKYYHYGVKFNYIIKSVKNIYQLIENSSLSLNHRIKLENQINEIYRLLICPAFDKLSKYNISSELYTETIEIHTELTKKYIKSK